MRLHISAESTLDKYPAKQHARRVANQLGVSGEDGLIYLQGAPRRYEEDSDQYRDFRQRRYFYYLSGVNEVDCHVTYDIRTDHLVLWLAPFTPTQVVWIGRGSSIEEALDKFQIDEARFSTGLGRYIKDWTEGHKAPVYLLHPDQRPPAPENVNQTDFDTKHLQPAIDRCRVIKDEHEIASITRANEISGRAHTEVLRNIKRFSSERQVAGLILDVSTALGAPHQAYSIIAGSGSNASVLHYAANNELFGDRQLMCLDAGAEYLNYASDVTRTFPLNGFWSKEAKQIYDIVQEMQNLALSMIKPGFRLFHAHLACHALAVRRLLGLGILHNGTEHDILKSAVSVAFYPHGLGHHLGLDVHDVAPNGVGIRKDVQTEFSPFDASTLEPCLSSSDGLSPGMVITVEPGLYFNSYALKNLYLNKPQYAKYINSDVLSKYMTVGGVRIEDDILITRTGYRVLTTAPKGEEALRIIRGEE